MAKKHKRGDDYLIYVNTGTQVSPTWGLCKSAVNPTFDPQKADIVIQEAGMSDGHLQGYGNPQIGFRLNNQKGDALVQDIVDAKESGDIIELAFADGPIATTGTVYYRLEACVTGGPLNANRGEGAGWDITVNRHADSEFDLTKHTAA